MDFDGKDHPINHEVIIFTQIGVRKLQEQDFFGALEEFKKAINLQPVNGSLYRMCAEAYEKLGDFQQAMEGFRKAQELDPEDFVASFRLGMSYYRIKDLEAAVNWLKISFSHSTDLSLEHIGVTNNNIFFVHKKVIANNIGNFLIQQNKFEEGLKYLDEAIKLDPNYPNPYTTKGGVLIQIGSQDEGIKMLKKASELGDPNASLFLLRLKV